MKYSFHFTQVVLEPEQMGHHHFCQRIIARTQLEALQKWCELPYIQNLGMDELGELTITCHEIAG